ncbi:cobalt-precorrin-6A reductase [Thioclava sp. BHET1]|nr:cobalt-precorrin-6A reductase [Thioclava sp. BHET1]
MARILLLGGTSEASELARALALRGDDAVFSYAGRTETPKAQPLPMRVGGFGEIAGLQRYLHAEAITHVIDATHPFAAQMSQNAVAACAEAGVALCAYERPAWRAQRGDRWTHKRDLEAACAALPRNPARVFLATGRQTLGIFAQRPEHFYLLRLVDPPQDPLPLPRAEAVIARGPFTESADLDLLCEHRIDLVVAKNAGGSGAYSKMAAARALGLPVIVIDRPKLPARRICGSVQEVLGFLDHGASTERGE